MKIDRAYIEKFDVIRRYHQNRLSEEELNSFEVYILEYPDILPELEQDQALADAYREHESLLKVSRTGIRHRGWLPGLTLAAGVFIAVMVTYNSLRQPQYDLQAPVTLETLRGTEAETVRASGKPVVQFRIDLGPAGLFDNNNFTVALIDSSASTRFEASGLHVDQDGWLYYTLNDQVETLTGNFEVRVYQGDDQNPLRIFPVEFTAL